MTKMLWVRWGLTIGARTTLVLGLVSGVARAQIWPTTQAKVEHALLHGPLESRRAAAKQLHQLPRSVSRRLIAKVVEEPDVQIRQSIGQLVLARRYSEFSSRIHGWLSDVDPNIRLLGARLLGLSVVGDDQVSLLARLLSDPVVEVRRGAAGVLAQAESNQAAQVLLNHLADSNDGVRLAVIDSLGALGATVATLPLVSRLQDANAFVRRATVEALGELEDANAVGALNLALLDADGEVRRAAVQAIAKIGLCDAVDGLRERMRLDREVAVRVAAVGALAQLGAKESCEPASRASIANALVDTLGHPQQELRSEALDSLRRFPQLALPELRSCLSHAAPTSTSATSRTMGCAMALAYADSAGRNSVAVASDAPAETYELILTAWRAGQLSDSELLVLLAIGKYDAGLPATLDLLASTSAHVRMQALDTAFELLDPSEPDGRAVDPLVAFLKTASGVDELARAIAVLGHTGARRAVPHLLAFAQEGAPTGLRIAAFRALAEIRRAAVPVASVAAGLGSESTELRAATARSVREGEWTGLDEALTAMLATSTYDEMAGIADALWGIAPNITKPQVVGALARQVENALPFHQDAFLEVFGRVPWSLTERYWKQWVERFSCRAQAKVAEVLGANDRAQALLVKLLHSKCENVVLNALWSLRHFALDESLSAEVLAMTSSEKSLVAGNAVATLAVPRSVPPSSEVSTASDRVLRALCEGLAGQRWGAAALSNALTGLRLNGHRCSDDGAVERTFLRHASSHVRKRAATLLLSGLRAGNSSKAALPLDQRALRQCARTDIDGEVAAVCTGEIEITTSTPEHWVTIVIVPEPDREPLPATPYALELGSGWIRSGTSDRRGAVFERVHAPTDATPLWL